MRGRGVLWAAVAAGVCAWSPAAAQEFPGVPGPTLRSLEKAAGEVAKRGELGDVLTLCDALQACGHPEADVRKLRTKLTAVAAKARGGKPAKAGLRALDRALSAMAGHLATLQDADRRKFARLMLRLDEQDAAANKALGHTQTDGRWHDPVAAKAVERRGAIQRVLQDARQLEVKFTKGSGADALLAELYPGRPVRRLTGHGLTCDFVGEDEKIERMLRETLRGTAVLEWLATGTLAIPALRNKRVVMIADALDYPRSIDAAVRLGILAATEVEISKQTSSFYSVRAEMYRYNLTEAYAEISMLIWLSRHGSWAAAQTSLLMGVTNWVGLTYIGHHRPGIVWVETKITPGSGGGGGPTRARPKPLTPAEREEMLRLAKAGIVGCKAWMAHLVRNDADPPWKDCQHDNEGKFETDQLLKCTTMIEFLCERDWLGKCRTGTARARGFGPVAQAFEKALAMPIAELEELWRRWLVPSLAGGVRQRLDPPPAVPLSKDERGALDYLNAIRTEAMRFVHPERWWDVKLEPELSRGCKLHAQYLKRHPGQAAKWPDAHEEYPDKDGFTAAGCRAGLNSVIAPGSNGPRDAIDGWMGTFYHRLPLIHGGLLRIGWGLDGGFAVLDSGSLVGKVMQVDMIVTWPADKARKVPRQFNPELPNPVPGEDQRTWGYPITVQCFVREDNSTPVVSKLTLRQGGADGPEVPCWFSSPTSPTNPRLAPADSYCLIPKAHLKGGTRYHVRADFVAWPHRKEWSFQTVR